MAVSAVSGGFAIVQPGSQLSINAVEGYPLEDFSIEAVRNQIQEVQKIASGSGSEQDIAEAKIELEVSFDTPCETLALENLANELIGFGELTGRIEINVYI